MAFGYHQPSDLGEALALLRGGAASVIAGGTDWYPARGRTPVTCDIVDLTRIEALRGIVWTAPGPLRIGAAATWSDLVAADLPPAFDGLRAAAREVGGIQIQNAGTIVGNLCNASPAADGVPPLLTLDAEVELASDRTTRRMPLSDFVTGPRQTALTPGELVTALHIPPPPGHARGAFQKLGARRYLVISIAMTAVVIGCDDAGRIDIARVAVGACGPVARRLPALERDLIGMEPSAVEVDADALTPLTPIDDVRADAGYRRAAVAHQIRRAIRRAVA